MEVSLSADNHLSDTTHMTLSTGDGSEDFITDESLNEFLLQELP